MKIENTIKKILVDELFVEVPIEEMEINQGMQAVYGLDSIGFAELRFNCEKEFDIEISDEEFNSKNFCSIGALTEFIKGKLVKN